MITTCIMPDMAATKVSNILSHIVIRRLVTFGAKIFRSGRNRRSLVVGCDKGFFDEGDYAFFWSSYFVGTTSAYGMGLHRTTDEALMGGDNVSGGQAVRCIKGAASISAGTLTDERDGQTYKTLKIGNQIWMAENLNYANKSSDGLDSSSFCYNDSLEYCEKYGRLYTWAAAVDSLALFSQNCMGCGYESSYSSFNNVVRGVCPDGWHLPTSTEWGTLYEYL